MKWEKLKQVFDRIFIPEQKMHWPSEVHYCGHNSEPLLNHDLVINSMKYLKSKDVILSIITNGICLEKYLEKGNEIYLVDKLSVSLDVVNDAHFKEFKKPKADTSIDSILKSIETINRNKDKHNPGLTTFVTFVATPGTYAKQEWADFFVRLKDIGVNHVRVRNDYTCFDKDFYNDVKNDIQQIAKEMDADCISYSRNPPFDLEYKEFWPRNEKCRHCFGLRLWCTISADFRLYSCAHVASQLYKPLVDLNENNDWYDIYLERNNDDFERKPVELCDGHCPSTMYYLNHAEVLDGV